MYCTKCGAPARGKFCRNCGAPIANTRKQKFKRSVRIAVLVLSIYFSLGAVGAVFYKEWAVFFLSLPIAVVLAYIWYKSSPKRASANDSIPNNQYKPTKPHQIEVPKITTAQEQPIEHHNRPFAAKSINSFIAFDFETADPKLQYPCSLGICRVVNGEIIQSKNYYINPEIPIAPQCERVHGISTNTVKGCPTFPEIWDAVKPLFLSGPIVAHNIEFDYRVLKNTLLRYSLDIPEFVMFDTMKLARAAGIEKVSLSALCKHFNITDFIAHNSSSDSECCARIFLELQNAIHEFPPYTPTIKKEEEYKTEYTISSNGVSYNVVFDWGMGSDIEQEAQPKTPDYAEAVVEYDDTAVLSIESKRFCLTGQIGPWDRQELKRIIAKHGGRATDSVSKLTDYLIVGFEDRNLVADKVNAKSTKIIKAEELRAAGEKIKIISDETFLSYLKTIGEL